jgi:hypothetical protein
VRAGTESLNKFFTKFRIDVIPFLFAGPSPGANGAGDERRRAFVALVMQCDRREDFFI